MSELTAWIEAFASAQREPDQVLSWVDRTLAELVEGVPELPADLLPAIGVAVRQHWLAFLDQVAESDGPRSPDFVLVPAAAELAIELARRELGLAVLLRTYRIAQEASWVYAIDVVRHAPAELDRVALLVWFWTRATTWFGRSVEESVLLHQQEEARIQQRGDTRRHELVAGVLAGRGVDPSLLSATLGGYPVGGSHVALIAHAMTPDAIPALEPTLLRVGGPGVVLVRPGGREMWAWVPSTHPPRIDLSGLDAAAVRVTVGGPAARLAGFVDAHRDARAAQRVALAPRRGEPVTRYDDVAALTLLAQDPAAAERFARRVLGGLADRSAGRLRETVRAVLTTAGGADAVAVSLGVHRNTVRYRLARAERLRGASLPARAGELLLALDFYETFLA